MSSDKYMKLVDSLYVKTARSKIQWKNGLGDGDFQVSFSDNSIVLRKEQNGLMKDYFIDLINAEGDSVDTISDVDLDRYNSDEQSRSYFNRLDELYTMARRYALGADKIINEILAEMDDDDDIF